MFYYITICILIPSRQFFLIALEDEKLHELVEIPTPVLSPHLSERRWPKRSKPVDPYIWSLLHWSATLSQFSNAIFGFRFRVRPLCNLPAPGPIVISHIGECDQLFCCNNHLWPKLSIWFIHQSFFFMTLFTVSVLRSQNLMFSVWYLVFSSWFWQIHQCFNCDCIFWCCWFDFFFLLMTSQNNHLRRGPPKINLIIIISGNFPTWVELRCSNLLKTNLIKKIIKSNDSKQNFIC